MRAQALARTALAALTLLAGCALVDAPAATEALQGQSSDDIVSIAAERDQTPAEAPPPIPREFRAAWVATVTNIDWPSRPGLPSNGQRDEAIAILDRAQAIGLNALILQVRPAADAMYPSTLEPWSEFLSGEQGRPPQPAWDPLAFWVQEAHRRGLELHAWFNPYRVRHSASRGPAAASHASQRMAGAVRRYGDQLWFDPGEPAAAAHTLAVIADVVRRYDIDGVHIDDYFYPYPVEAAGTELPFPDDDSYARYLLAGPAVTVLTRDDWRRSQVDELVRNLYATVHSIKPWVRVGISPFGIGRPDRRPPGISGFSQYDKLYADVERWLEQGWMDYLAPQLYWSIASEGQAFAPLLDYWLMQGRQQRPVWPGLFTSRIAAKGWTAREVLDQVGEQRRRAGPDATTLAAPQTSAGHIHFSMSALMQDRDGIAGLLQRGPYAQPALVPESPWLADAAPSAPVLQAQRGKVKVVPGSGPPPQRWAVWRRMPGREGAPPAWRFDVLAVQQRIIDVRGLDALVVYAVGRNGRISEPAVLRFP